MASASSRWQEEVPPEFTTEEVEDESAVHGRSTLSMRSRLLLAASPETSASKLDSQDTQAATEPEQPRTA